MHHPYFKYHYLITHKAYYPHRRTRLIIAPATTDPHEKKDQYFTPEK